jgi:hypothetical protein
MSKRYGGFLKKEYVLASEEVPTPKLQQIRYVGPQSRACAIPVLPHAANEGEEFK